MAGGAKKAMSEPQTTGATEISIKNSARKLRKTNRRTVLPRHAFYDAIDSVDPAISDATPP
jgi:hypothetical protein